jgi:hypothetical protein
MLPSIADLDLQAVDEIDHVVEATVGHGSDAPSGNRSGPSKVVSQWRVSFGSPAKRAVFYRAATPLVSLSDFAVTALRLQ